MSLKKSSLFVLIVLFALFFASMMSNVWLLTRSNHSLDDVNKEIRVVLSIIDPINHSRTSRVRVMEYMKEIENGNGQQLKPALDSVMEATGKADAAFQAYLNAPKLPGEAPLAEAYRATYQDYRQNGIQPLVEAAQAGDQAQFKARIPAVVKLDRQYEIVLDKVLALHEKYAKNLNNEAQSNFNFGIGLTVAFCLLFLVVILAVMVFMKRYVLNPLLSSRDHCRQIAEGYLDTPVPVRVNSRSEIQELMQSMEHMRMALTQIISQVRDTSHTVAHASQEISAGNIDLASRTEQQAAALTETAASMEELGATVKQN